jgi:nucleoside 2-deoxyribosyltransferase
MIVVGGTYTEHCVDPTRVRLLGSGLRAAFINRQQLEKFVTAVHPSERDQVAATLGVPNAALAVVERAHPVRFVYETPISRPSLYGAMGEVPKISADGDQALVFGMVDGRPEVRARQAVIDPQSSLSLTAVNEDVRADQKVIVANARELRFLTGATELDHAMSAALDATGAVAVVAKCGIAGCAFLTNSGSPTTLAAWPTSNVWPIGSGDAFSAGFAAHWFEHGDLKAAGEAGIAAAACVCSTDQLTLRPIDPMLDLGSLTFEEMTQRPRVYLAASFASIHQRWLLRQVARAMRDIGIEPFSPLHENGLYDGDAATIATRDLEGIEASASVLLLADGSRTGPWVEAGWATRLERPVVIFTEDDARDRYTMLVGTGAQVVADLASAIYRAGWLALAARTRP